MWEDLERLRISRNRKDKIKLYDAICKHNADVTLWNGDSVCKTDQYTKKVFSLGPDSQKIF